MANITSDTQISTLALKLALITIAFFLLSSSNNVQAQNYKKALKIYKKSLSLERKGKKLKAFHLMEKSVKADADFKEARLKLATDLLKLGKERQAEIHYQELIARHPDYSMIPYLELGKIAQKKGDYKSSAKLMLEVLHRAKENSELNLLAQKIYKNSIFLITANQNEEQKMLRLSKAINSPYDEYHPRFSADGNMLIFTRKIESQEDFYLSTKADGIWQTSIPMKKPINTTGNEGAHCLSADGRFLYFTACLRDDGVGSCDIYVSERKGNEWQTPVNLGTKINSRYWDSQPSISADGNTLYFVSNRSGGEGGIDIWFSTLGNDEKWTQAKNLGSPINTPYKDYSPFLHPNSVQIYFSSEGHPGYGGSDIFFSTRTGENWQQPINLGSAINDKLDQNSLSVSIDGKTGWLAREEKNGQLDIYQFSMPEKAKPIPAIYLKGMALSANDSLGIKAELRLTNLNDGINAFNSETSEDGSFIICIPATRPYAFHLRSPGYFPLSVNLDSALSSNNSEHLTFYLKAIELHEVVRLNNIFFALNSSELEKSSMEEIKITADFLDSNPGLQIEIQGHTDNTGNSDYNLKLSRERAKSVMEAILRLGIDKSRLSYRGFGDTKPIAANDSDENRRMNRRTEFLVKKLD